MENKSNRKPLFTKGGIDMAKRTFKLAVAIVLLGAGCAAINRTNRQKASTPTPDATLFFPVQPVPELTPTFAPLLQAQPEDSAPVANSDQTEVWVNNKTGVYHYRGSRWYGNTKNGHFSSEAEARASGNRAAENGQ